MSSRDTVSGESLSQRRICGELEHKELPSSGGKRGVTTTGLTYFAPINTLCSLSLSTLPSPTTPKPPNTPSRDGGTSMACKRVWPFGARDDTEAPIAVLWIGHAIYSPGHLWHAAGLVQAVCKNFRQCCSNFSWSGAAFASSLLCRHRNLNSSHGQPSSGSAGDRCSCGAGHRFYAHCPLRQ